LNFCYIGGVASLPRHWYEPGHWEFVQGCRATCTSNPRPS
jgi:hypothetical protein